ncbi:F0F1 ATP synthase subunit delta [uncultured Microbulbifer sp.]|uniref:F0F1 ATP synthase subunit delta n=1 Tax=uncultured Microbulbifer sp. TaxID=348147 RepID=UPI0025F7DD93|nr:F0F1 ATP synthase subunit delta [uncultured Microbulbifer sp.]
MELNWTTFLLEIINFLVLVWLLKRFFYKPLQAAIARRQAAIDQRIEKARKMEEDAQQLQQQYEKDLAALERERELAREQLQREISDERKKQEQELAASLQKKREQAAVVEQRQARELQRQQQQTALEQGSRFASRLLQEGAGPELQTRLQALLLDSLREIPAEQLARWQDRLGADGDTVEVVSAFPLEADSRGQITQALQRALQRDVHCHFAEDSGLIAGLRINMGPWVLGTNVRDELDGFARLERETVRDG